VSGFGATWQWYLANATAINPIGTFVGAIGAFATAAILAWAGLRNARAAAENAHTAARRHEEQTKADRQRRITESFSKATEQLASEKIEARLGGIYTLERISRESPDDYWAIMETLTAFVRKHARWKERDKIASETLESLYDDEKSKDAVQPEPATDIAAILAVIVRREDENRDREMTKGWRLDFTASDLRRARLAGAHLEGARLAGAHLEGAELRGAHLERASLREAHLQGARLAGAHLQGANLFGAHLEGAHLFGAHLEGANLAGAHLEGADLSGTHLEKVEGQPDARP